MWLYNPCLSITIKMWVNISKNADTTPGLSYTLHQPILTQCKLLTIVLHVTTNEIWQKAVFFRRWFEML